MNWGEEREESAPMLTAEIDDSLADTESDNSGDEDDLAVNVKRNKSVEQLYSQKSPIGSTLNLSYS